MNERNVKPLQKPAALYTWEQDPADHPRHDDQKQRQKLQITGHQRGCSCVTNVLRSQCSLHNNLVKRNYLWWHVPKMFVLVFESLHGIGTTWSAHQYHMDTNVDRIRTPGHGRSEVKGSLRMWKASSLGKPQELMEYDRFAASEALVMLELKSPYCLGTASKYLTINASSPPTFTKAAG